MLKVSSREASALKLDVFDTSSRGVLGSIYLTCETLDKLGRGTKLVFETARRHASKVDISPSDTLVNEQG